MSASISKKSVSCIQTRIQKPKNNMNMNHNIEHEELPKIIEQTSDYNILEAKFNDYTQQFRMWHNGVTEMRFDDQFAKANGYENIQDLINKMNGMKEYLNIAFGKVPEWIAVDPATGFIGFTILGTQTKVSLN